MKQEQTLFQLSTQGQGLYEFTRDLTSWVAQCPIENGLLTLFCKHTSASLTIQENADPDVQLDLNEFFARLVPEHMDWLRHTMEGPDDMPAHIKSALTDVSLNIPISNGRPTLGTWQGVYLFEHRKHPHQRQVVAHLMGM
ncbi:secondary thiamine-phosphate synthase enzyme YjbQ [Terasakiella sp. SH-1]|uniref:secondary thiamine-phosphate synthase enzyme YjbQ n=1 Tax=Terasakiella sp. SH-1 TaxID=2560057 RepID=UPI00107430A4|nr:secondary thiamine-phosphate synthase enzyme YjbQ [Terasakiella sp. SH-1]